MEIRYLEKGGELWFSFTERVPVPTQAHSRVYRVYESSGKIPEEIQKQGQQAIRTYAEKKVEADIKKQKIEAKKHDEFAKNPDFSVSVKHDYKLLKGKIISTDDNVLRVRLEKPYQGEDYVIYGFGSAMLGKHIFDRFKSFSEDAIEHAKILLVRIYEQKKHYDEHKEVINLANQLNSPEN